MVRVPCIIQKSEQEPLCLCQGAARTTESPAAFLLGELSHLSDLNYFSVLSKEVGQPFRSVRSDAQRRGSKNSWCIFSRQSRKDLCRAPRPHHHQKCLPWDRGGAKDLSSSLGCHKAPSGRPHSLAEATHLYVLLTVVLVWLHRYYLHTFCTSCICVFIYMHACVIYRHTHVCVSVYLRSRRTVRSWGEISADMISCWQKMFYLWAFLMVVIATTAASGRFCGAVQGGCCAPRAGLLLPVALVAKGTSGSCPWTWHWEQLCTSGRGSCWIAGMSHVWVGLVYIYTWEIGIFTLGALLRSFLSLLSRTVLPLTVLASETSLCSFSLSLAFLTWCLLHSDISFLTVLS